MKNWVLNDQHRLKMSLVMIYSRDLCLLRRYFQWISMKQGYPDFP